MEAVGLAASVVALAELTAKICVLSLKLKDLWDELKDVPERLSELVNDLKMWEIVLTVIENQVKRTTSDVHLLLLRDVAMPIALGKCRSALNSLGEIVKDLETQVEKTKNLQQKIMVVKTFFSSRKRLDTLEQKVHRAFETVHMVSEFYSTSARLGPTQFIPATHLLTGKSTFTGRRAQSSHNDNQADVDDSPQMRHSIGALSGQSEAEPPELPHSRLSQQRELIQRWNFEPSRPAKSRLEGLPVNIPSCREMEDQSLLQRNVLLLKNMPEMALVSLKSRRIQESRRQELRNMHHGLGNFDTKPVEQNYLVNVHMPGWLGGRIYDIGAERSAEGWQVITRSRRVVRFFDDRIYQIVARDDDAELIRYLHANMQNWMGSTQQENGWMLIHLASRLGSLKCVEFLITLSAPLDRSDWSAGDWKRTPWALACHCTMGKRFVWNYIEILFAFEVAHMSDTKLTEAFLYAIQNSWSSEFVQAFRDQFVPKYADIPPLMQFLYARLAATSDFYTCPSGLFFELLPETEIHIAEFSRAQDCSIIQSMALHLGKKSVKELLTDEEISRENVWWEMLQNCISTDTDSLHHLEHISLFDTLSPCNTPFISFLNSAFEASLGGLMKDSMTNLLQRWLTTLEANGIDLFSYGRQEKRLYEENNSILCQRFVQLSGQQRYRIRLVGITYGNLPRHWSLTWVDESDGFARDFWNLVEPQEMADSNPSDTMPGEWTEEPDENSDDEDDPWTWAEQSEPRRLVWAEYRRQRQPATKELSRRHTRREPVSSRGKAASTKRPQPLDTSDQPEDQPGVAPSGLNGPSSVELRRRAKGFMKFWKRGRRDV